MSKSKKQLEQVRQLGKRPRTEKQLENCRRMGKLPKTSRQLESARENARKLGKRPKTEKQIQASRENYLNRKGQSHLSSLNANTIVEHHNDLCHGIERPNDVTLMTHSKHSSLHNNLRANNGTHPFLTKNRKTN